MFPQLDCPLVIAVILASGVGGTFQYGYSISVMTSPSAFIKDLMNRTCVQRYNVHLEQWQVSLFWSFTVAIYSFGGFLGSLLCGSFLSKYGRKKGMLYNNFWAIFGAVLMILSQLTTSYEMIVVARLLYGINAGVSFVAHPMYVIECTPKRLRGIVGVTIATCMSLGKLTGQVLGIRELLGTEKNWPWLLGFNGFTALAQLLTLPLLPDSPSFLLQEKGDRQGCEKALKRLWGDGDHSGAMEEMMEEKAVLQNVRSHSVLELIQDRRVRWQFITILVAFTSVQFCGIGAVYFYSFEVFRAAGIPEVSLPYAAVGIGLCELFASFTCVSITRKVLMVRGYLIMAATLILLTVTLSLQTLNSWLPYCSMVLIFILVFFFACGPAGVTPSLPGHIFSPAFKTAAYTIAASNSWTFLFIVGIIFPLLVDNLGYCCFLIFLFFCIACGVFVKFNVPETNNLTIMEITAEFDRMHGKSGTACSKTSAHNNLNGIKTQETRF
uniref:Solute carrier family 2, facilitated glucose transporter member 5 n=1 Tax=Salarias fasciatus TaxID=181472 RepID=A0A672JJM9_SALFA